ncbi:MAG: protein phosphatase 2C domain-containing protein [Mycobacterium sp.]
MRDGLTTPTVVDGRAQFARYPSGAPGSERVAATTVLPRPRPLRCGLEFDDGSFLVVRGRGLIGRDPAASGDQPVHRVLLADAACMISRTHLEFWTHEGRLWVRDCNSRNGSEVEIHGRRIRMNPGMAVPVPPTSTIHIGRQRIRVRAVDRRAVVGAVTVEWGAATRAGAGRERDQDTFAARAPVFAVADGIGGHSAGELASREAVQALLAVAEHPEITDAMLNSALARARARIEEIPVGDATRRPGTTISGAIVTHHDGIPRWMVVNLGDSRTYRLDATGLHQITVDHSVGQKLLEAGVTAHAGPSLPIRNILTRALVGGVEHKPDVWRLPMRAGDRILVCSDGLPAAVDDARIRRVLQMQRDPQAAVDALIDAAIRAGGSDDMTAVVVDAVSIRAPHYSDTSTRAARRSGEFAVDGSTSTRVRWRA